MIDFTIVRLVTVAAAAVALLSLNIFLSTRKNPVFSFILPVLSFLISIVFLVAGLSVFSDENSSESFSLLVKSFFIFNVPTLVFIISSLLARYLRKKL
ncbi:MAG: hypothetical protein IJU39_06080 [Clostridia bacterium]|nr:hypothetical protein [Clostridia bacterium]